MSETLWTYESGSIGPDDRRRGCSPRITSAGPRKLGPVAGAFAAGGGGHWTFALLDGAGRYELTCDRGGIWTVRRWED